MPNRATTETYPLEVRFDGRVFSANLIDKTPELFAGALRLIADSVENDGRMQEMAELRRRLGVES